jgi:hypothetical protein
MTPQQFKDARAKLGLTAKQMGLALQLKAPERNVFFYEAGDYSIRGPVIVAMRYFLKHGLDKTARKAAGIEGR